jgi:hypothetical protein
MADVFISYAREDRMQAGKLAQALSQMSPESIPTAAVDGSARRESDACDRYVS